MAAVNVTLVGLGNGEPFTFVGMASLTGLGVGGGPILPPSSPGHPSHPIYPGEHPEHPIVLPPDKPDVPPPGIWPGPGDPDYPAGPHPEHPIVIPPPQNPGEPPIPPGTLIEWKAYWSPETGWIVLGHPNVPHPSPSR